jgi:hypothetical protein
MKVNFKGAIVVIIFAMVSCTKESFELKNPDDCNLSALTYENGINTIINNNCAYSGCHSGNIEIFDFTGYEGVKTGIGSFADRINRSVEDPLFMPQSKFELSECDLAKLNTWISNGAPFK